jgi:hypothetical protein
VRALAAPELIDLRERRQCAAPGALSRPDFSRPDYLDSGRIFSPFIFRLASGRHLRAAFSGAAHAMRASAMTKRARILLTNT